MADTPLQPMTDADIVPSPASDAVAAEAAPTPSALTTRAGARDAVSTIGQQAGDQVRTLAETGKEKVGGLLDQLAQMLTDAAAQVDDKLGEQYGAHARNAATTVQGFAQTVRDKDVDAFADDVRGYVAKSPAVALGVAAALGFGLARVVHAGIEQRA